MAVVTSEEYRLHAPVVEASGPEIGPDVQLVYESPVDVLIASASTEERQAEIRAMRDLIDLSFDPDSMDRESEVDIWGFHEAE